MSSFERLLRGSCGCGDLLACMYGLNQLETDAYFVLVRERGVKLEDLARQLERDRSTVYRAVQTLRSLHLVDRETVCIKSGGYFHAYRAADPEAVRLAIERRMNEFRQHVDQALSRFEDEVERRVRAVDASHAAQAQAGTEEPVVRPE